MRLQTSEMVGLVRICVGIKETHKRNDWQCVFRHYPKGRHCLLVNKLTLNIQIILIILLRASYPSVFCSASCSQRDLLILVSIVT